MRDELYHEVREYRDRFRDCDASYILAKMGESRNFFYQFMEPKDIALYQEKILELNLRTTLYVDTLLSI